MIGGTIKTLVKMHSKKITKNPNSLIWPFSLTNLLCSTELHLFQAKKGVKNHKIKQTKKKCSFSSEQLTE